MKLTTEEIAFIESSTRTAAQFGVDSLIIDNTGCRGWNEDRTVWVRRQADNVPPLSFDSICINRVPLFISRLDIAKTQEDYHIDALLDEKDDWVKCITFKGKGTKIEYRGSNPIKTKIPKNLKDDRAVEIRLNGEAVLLLQKGMSAMKAETVSIISNDEVTFELLDVNKDVFSYTFPDKAIALSDANTTKFAHKYQSKVLLSLFKRDPTRTFKVGGRVGTLSVTVDDMEVHIIPQK